MTSYLAYAVGVDINSAYYVQIWTCEYLSLKSAHWLIVSCQMLLKHFL